jgi:hypothetical protein
LRQEEKGRINGGKLSQQEGKALQQGELEQSRWDSFTAPPPPLGQVTVGPVGGCSRPRMAPNSSLDGRGSFEVMRIFCGKSAGDWFFVLLFFLQYSYVQSTL